MHFPALRRKRTARYAVRCQYLLIVLLYSGRQVVQALSCGLAICTWQHLEQQYRSIQERYNIGQVCMPSTADASSCQPLYIYVIGSYE